MANLIDIIIRANDTAGSVLRGVVGDLDSVGGKLTQVGKQVTVATAAITAGRPDDTSIIPLKTSRQEARKS